MSVHEEVLENGLRVLVQEVHTAPLASVWCWYRVGSKDEAPGTTGVSHWVEHMNFKGTTNIPRDKVKGIIEQFGGYWNGYTWIDQTTYTETATRDALDRMLFIESERMANCLYDPEDCESERTVIISELQGGENDPDTLLDQELTATALKAHPYRHPTIGWLPDLQTMTREDFYGYYRRFYVPNNATLVVVGDVDTKDAMRTATEHFGRIPPGDVVRRAYTQEPEQLGERRVTISREGTTAYLKLAYHAPGIDDPDFFPMLVLDAILTGAKGSQPVGELPHAAATAKRAPVSAAGEHGPCVLGVRRPACRRSSRFCTRYRRPRPTARRSSRSRTPRSRSSIGPVRRASPHTKSSVRRISVRDVGDAVVLEDAAGRAAGSWLAQLPVA